MLHKMLHISSEKNSHSTIRNVNLKMSKYLKNKPFEIPEICFSALIWKCSSKSTENHVVSSEASQFDTTTLS